MTELITSTIYSKTKNPKTKKKWERMKTLKWIYNLGKKHEERRLYTAFIVALNGVEPDELELFDFDGKSTYTKEELVHRKQLANRLKSMVEDIFHPYKYEEQESPRRVNRFK